VKQLNDLRLYSDTNHCLARLRDGLVPPTAAPPVTFHAYWRGRFGPKQALSVRSVLATQAGARVHLRLDAQDGFEGHETLPDLAPLLDRVKVSVCDPQAEVDAMRLPVRIDGNDTHQADAFRLLALHQEGGVYFDLDVVFLRDLGPLRNLGPFCYQWSGEPHANNAVLYLEAVSKLTTQILKRCRKKRSFRPWEVLRKDAGELRDLLLLPCAFFDPLWLRFDGHDPEAHVPFSHFDSFFNTSEDASPAAVDERFFPGAFAYHWHNRWDAKEEEGSWFSALQSRFAQDEV
jgi:hypothetical protein